MSIGSYDCPEQWPGENWARDIKKMAEVGKRTAEFWSTPFDYAGAEAPATETPASTSWWDVEGPAGKARMAKAWDVAVK